MKLPSERTGRDGTGAYEKDSEPCEGITAVHAEMSRAPGIVVAGMALVAPGPRVTHQQVDVLDRGVAAIRRSVPSMRSVVADREPDELERGGRRRAETIAAGSSALRKGELEQRRGCGDTEQQRGRASSDG